MAIYIKFIWSKTCPVCKEMLKRFLLRLQALLPDKLVIDFYETSPGPEYEGYIPYLSGGAYKTFYGKTPEIYIEDKMYIIPVASYVAVYKFFKELRNILEKEGILKNMTFYRQELILKELQKMEKELRDLARKELEMKALLEE